MMLQEINGKDKWKRFEVNQTGTSPLNHSYQQLFRSVSNVIVSLFIYFVYLHDISKDNTVDKFGCDTPCSEGSFGRMLSQVRCTVILQHTTISAEWSALGSNNKYTCRETEHLNAATRTSHQAGRCTVDFFLDWKYTVYMHILLLMLQVFVVLKVQLIIHLDWL